MGKVVWTHRPSDRGLRNDISNLERLTGRSQAAQQAENTGSSTGDSEVPEAKPWPEEGESPCLIPPLGARAHAGHF